MVSSHLALTMLARFSRDESNDPNEIRAYVRDSADVYAVHLGPEAMRAIETAEDDHVRAAVAAAVRDARESRRAARSVERARDAQASADVLSSTLTRDAYGRIDLDALSLLSSCLTCAGASLLVHVDDHALAFPMAPLIATERVTRDAEVTLTLRAWIEVHGDAPPILHVRWTNAYGREAGYRWRGNRVEIFPAAYFAPGGRVEKHAEDVSVHLRRAWPHECAAAMPRRAPANDAPAIAV